MRVRINEFERGERVRGWREAELLLSHVTNKRDHKIVTASVEERMRTRKKRQGHEINWPLKRLERPT